MTDSPAPRPHRRTLVHLTTTDMSLDWLLRPQLVAFGEAGYDVIGMSAPGPHVDTLERSGIRHVAVPSFTRSSSVGQDLRAFGELIRLMRRERPDILHTHNPKPGILGRIAGRIAGVPLVVNTQHGLYAQPTDRRRRRWPVYAAERVAAAFGHVELVQNEEDVRTLVERLHVPRSRVRLLGNGIDLDRFDLDAVAPTARSSRRAEWGAGDDEVVCCVVGRLVREKGIEEILRAAHLLHERAVPVRFVVIGPEEPDKSDAVDVGLLDRARTHGVVLTGTRGDMPECYAASDVFVTASWREGVPRAAMEATAMRLPVIATDIRGNRQVVVDGVTGTIVPVRDPVALADAVEHLARHPDERARYAIEARQHAEREFDQQQVIECTLAAYRLLDGRPGRSAVDR